MNYDPKIKKICGKPKMFYAERRLAQHSTRLVDAVKNLKGVRLEIHGYCLLLTGNTYLHKEKLLNLKFKWDWRKKRWYKSMTFTQVN